MSKGHILKAAAIAGMDKFMALARIAAGISDSAHKLKGSELSDEELICRAQELFPTKPYCLVRDWVLVDVNDSALLRLPQGVQPRVVFAGKVIDDQAERFDRPKWIRSTFEVSFTEGYFFE